MTVYVLLLAALAALPVGLAMWCLIRDGEMT
jgi:hypothetical protein